MKLIKVKDINIPKAVDLYLLAEEWTIYNHFGISESAAYEAITAPNSFWRFVIEGENTVVGLVGFERINTLDRIGEPFISIAPLKRGIGCGLEAMQLLFKAGKDDIGLRRMQMTVLAGAPSHTFFEKFKDSGFLCEGILKKIRFKNGKYIDALLYAWVDDKEIV